MAASVIGGILPVEPGGVELHSGIVQRRFERKVGGGGDPARGVGHDQWQPQRTNLLAQAQQRFGFGSGTRVVEAAEHAGVEAAGGRWHRP